ncbi:hypothetical protein [Thalassolituus oleivorans]|uniref:hypothetical protein n=1 Tax=Thalassolituus oleivorans TaxID=187493 RepID=UPI001CE245AF|nr:hypothetical protein [Thalassolituus oleivorans]MCA6129175.1 hypothetical protein [Thalassolituus oleivorans 4BN06-13]
MSSKYLIIAGTEKAGTTSLFQYLLDSGFYFPSHKKETDYFRRETCFSEKEYEREFDTNNSRGCCFLEASPGYLADSSLVVKNISSLDLGYILFVFLLRSPLGRLKSSFLFHKSRLYIDRNMTIDEYIDLCFRYEAGESAIDLGLDDWFLRVLDSGRYFKHLCDYMDLKNKEIKIYSFEEFSRDPKSCVVSIQRTMGFPYDLYNDYDFHVSNVTAGHRSDFIQKYALLVNHAFEKFFYRYPGVKKKLLKIYRILNGAEKEVASINDFNMNRLLKFYSNDMEHLLSSGLISREVFDTWIKEFRR